MPRTRPAVALAVALALVPAGAAQAGTTRTDQTPEQIRAYHDSGEYARDIAAVYASATRSIRSQLRRRVRRPAVVLDIDETSLSNYPCFDANDFDLSGLSDCIRYGRSVAIPAAREYFRFVRRRRVAVFFVTGTPALFAAARRANLRKEGFLGTYEVIGRPDDDKRDSVVPFKSGARRSIQRRGYTILASIGDQQSDLTGGYARRTFKLPNPIYVTS